MEAALLTKPWINHCVRPYGMEIEILGCSHIELIYASATAELDRKCVSDNRTQATRGGWGTMWERALRSVQSSKLCQLCSCRPEQVGSGVTDAIGKKLSAAATGEGGRVE